VRTHVLEIRIATGEWDSGVSCLDDEVDVRYGCGEGTQTDEHVAREPGERVIRRDREFSAGSEFGVVSCISAGRDKDVTGQRKEEHPSTKGNEIEEIEEILYVDHSWEGVLRHFCKF